ncbi:hypothetical protein PR202_gb07378 [Eleusine coracana subsp. coracana]|uniref:Uncharacterized protein n=1 Tax=Eleusine coracana subsp. coracana TaxID=191504 RepID=A0AAV5EBW3_ELECO|nr:hypothetical protein PR202_gb07378 [Eleusine coracana subsp. coracana]
MDARVSKEWENPFSVTATMGEILEVQPSGGGGEREPEKVFVAVPEQYKHGKSVLAWALRHAAAMGLAGTGGGAVVVVLMHVHVPVQMIPMSTYSHRHTTSLRTPMCYTLLAPTPVVRSLRLETHHRRPVGLVRL